VKIGKCGNVEIKKVGLLSDVVPSGTTSIVALDEVKRNPGNKDKNRK
jgi:hypothetical protein